MHNQRFSESGAAPEDDIEDSRRDSSFFETARDVPGRQWGNLGRLEDDRVAERQGGRGFPDRNRDGEVPGSDQRTDSQRYATGIEESFRTRAGDHIAFGAHGLRRMVAKD